MEAGSEVSEPAGSAFVRRQTLLAAGIYGPLAASLSDDGSVAGALWLVVTGGTFFASYGASQSQAISRAQNHLAGHLGLASGLAAGLLTYAATGDDGGKGVRAAALAGGAAGTIAGLSMARTMSDAEAHAATGGIESAALVGWAATQAAGLSQRGTAGAVAAAVVAGYPIGLAYPRSVSYTVTAGDVDAVGSAGLIGGLAAGTFLGDRPSKQTAAAVLGAGYVVGLALGDRLIARPFDLTQSESNLAGIGAVAGGLIGLAIPVLAGSDQSNFVVGTAALGATLGFTAVVNMSRHRVGSVGSINKSLDLPGRKLFKNINLSGSSILGTMAHIPGRYSVVNWSF